MGEASPATEEYRLPIFFKETVEFGRRLPEAAVFVLLNEELCVASLLLLRRKSGRRCASR
jgi:hypothetical protein